MKLFSEIINWIVHNEPSSPSQEFIDWKNCYVFRNYPIRSRRIICDHSKHVHFFIAINKRLPQQSKYPDRCTAQRVSVCELILHWPRLKSHQLIRRRTSMESINQLIWKYFNFKIDCLMTEKANNTVGRENKTFAPAQSVSLLLRLQADPLRIISLLPQGTNITLTTIAIHSSLSLPENITS